VFVKSPRQIQARRLRLAGNVVKVEQAPVTVIIAWTKILREAAEAVPAEPGWGDVQGRGPGQAT